MGASDETAKERRMGGNMEIVIVVAIICLLAGFTLGCRHTYRKCTEDIRILIAELEARTPEIVDEAFSKRNDSKREKITPSNELED